MINFRIFYQFNKYYNFRYSFKLNVNTQNTQTLKGSIYLKQKGNLIKVISARDVPISDFGPIPNTEYSASRIVSVIGQPNTFMFQGLKVLKS